MRTLFLSTLLGAGIIALLADQAPAHGGIYRGPGDVVPPSPGGGTAPRTPTGPAAPGTGRPTGPSGNAPTSPSTGNPVSPRNPTTPAGRGAPRTGGGAPLEPDLGTWDFWWEFNKDSYLGLREALAAGAPVTGDDEIWMGPTRQREVVDAQRPTHNELVERVLPGLRRTLASTQQRDITSSCLVAMAKIGADHPEFRLVDVFAPTLRRGDQELRETAALAIGIAARVGNGEVELLAGLALDDRHGRQAVGAEVDQRTRSFALYALGLLAHEHTDLAIKSAAFEVMQQVLADASIGNRNPKVAAIHAISLLNVDRGSAAAAALQDRALAALERFYAQKLGAGGQLVQAHCPTAIAKVIGRDHPRAFEFRRLFLGELRGDQGQRTSHDLARSSALALGRLCRPHDGPDSPDAAASELLLATFHGHKDEQTRSFAALALGQIGGIENRKVLLAGLRRGTKGIERPWCALALGVLAHAELMAQNRRGADATADVVIGDALLEQLEAAQDPGLVGALGVACGLSRTRDAAELMKKRMLADLQKEAQAGYLCLGLGLMREVGAREDVRKVLDQATRRPDLLKQAAVALGLLGDKSAAGLLRNKLCDPDAQPNLATFAALAAALGLIGDRTSLEPLQRLLDDTQRTDLARAFAAVAIGGIADRAPLPWHQKLAADLNYRAAVETLTDSQTGILDIL